jgi:hypothetical protein
MRENCLSGGNGGLGLGDRVILFSNWDDPEFTKSFEEKYNIRTGIVQGFGDRLVAMMNMIAYVAHAIGHPERMLQCRNFAAG